MYAFLCVFFSKWCCRWIWLTFLFISNLYWRQFQTRIQSSASSLHLFCLLNLVIWLFNSYKLCVFKDYCVIPQWFKCSLLFFFSCSNPFLFAYTHKSKLCLVPQSLLIDHIAEHLPTSCLKIWVGRAIFDFVQFPNTIRWTHPEQIFRAADLIHGTSHVIILQNSSLVVHCP